MFCCNWITITLSKMAGTSPAATMNVAAPVSWYSCSCDPCGRFRRIGELMLQVKKLEYRVLLIIYNTKQKVLDFIHKIWYY